jgi:hypothetical protein
VNPALLHKLRGSRATQRSNPSPWWLWPTILSLDAPAVVVLWQGLIARSASVGEGQPEEIVLGSSVWLAYCADRWIEGWRLAPESILHPPPPVSPDVALADPGDLGRRARPRHPRGRLGLPAAEFRAGLVVLLPVAAYLLSHQLVHRRSRWRAPKEVCVAMLLGGRAPRSLPWARPGADLRGAAAPLGLFVLLCFSNCALISVWEDEVDLSHGQTSLALQFGRSAAALSRALPWAVAACSAAVWLCGLTHARQAAACAAASGVLLGLVDIAEPRIGRVLARVLADVAPDDPLRPFSRGRPMSGARSGFDRLAGPYRALEFAAFGRDLERARFAFLGRLAGCRDILLLGEGDGRCAARLAAIAPGARILCVDSSPGMIARASRRISRAGGRRAGHLPVRRCRSHSSRSRGPSTRSRPSSSWTASTPSGRGDRRARRPRPAAGRAVWLFADFVLPAGGMARLRARAWLAVLYAFFRAGTGLRTSSLPPSERVLESAGWARRSRKGIPGRARPERPVPEGCAYCSSGGICMTRAERESSMAPVWTVSLSPAGGDCRHRREVAEEDAVVAVHHDPEQLARLAEDEVAAGGREVAEQALEEAVVDADVARVRGVELETELAVALAAPADEERLGELEGSAARG